MRHTRYGAVQLPKIKQFCKRMQREEESWSEKKKEKKNGKQCGGFKSNFQYILSHWYEKWFSSIKTKQRRERECVKSVEHCVLCATLCCSSNAFWHFHRQTLQMTLSIFHLIPKTNSCPWCIVYYFSCIIQILYAVCLYAFVLFF